MKRRFRIEVIDRAGRLRAILKDERGFTLAEWWLTSAAGKRYKPFKPAPPIARFIINRLPARELERVALRLLTARPGDKVEFEVEIGGGAP